MPSKTHYSRTDREKDKRYGKTRKTKYTPEMDDLKEKRGYWKFKEEALDRNL
jgi:hypothetical protein